MNEYIKNFLQAIWKIGVVFLCLMALVDIITFFDLYSFEYYGYNQWPWIYTNKVIYFRYIFSIFLICILGIGYSYRYLKKSLIKALIIIVVTTIVTSYLFIF